MSHHIEGVKFYSFVPVKAPAYRVYVVENVAVNPNTRVLSILSKIVKYFKYPLEANIKLKIKSSNIAKLNPEQLSYLVYLLSDIVVPFYLNKYESHSQALIGFAENIGDGSTIIHCVALITKKDIKSISRRPTIFVAIVKNNNKNTDIVQVSSLYKMTWLYLSQMFKMNKNIDVSYIPMKTYTVLISFESKSEESRYIEVTIPELHESIKVRIPIRPSAWTLEDLPPKLREELDTIVIRPITQNTAYAPKGILITGPPGVGKSVTAEVIAAALRLNIIELRPTMYRSMWYGLTEKILENVLKTIRSRKNALVLVDDADFLVGRHVSVHETHVSEVTILLRYLQEPSRPLTILTTNAPELLDSALIRPGRIDVIVIMGYPDKELRKQIALKNAKRYGITLPTELLDTVANITRWFSNAEIDALIRLAASKGEGKITEESLFWARNRFNINEQLRSTIQNQ
ncbi:MAG: ATP-binding protein, partial [Ignisphaera sp.]